MPLCLVCFQPPLPAPMVVLIESLTRCLSNHLARLCSFHVPEPSPYHKKSCAISSTASTRSSVRCTPCQHGLTDKRSFSWPCTFGQIFHPFQPHLSAPASFPLLIVSASASTPTKSLPCSSAWVFVAVLCLCFSPPMNPFLATGPSSSISFSPSESGLLLQPLFLGFVRIQTGRPQHLMQDKIHHAASPFSAVAHVCGGWPLQKSALVFSSPAYRFTSRGLALEIIKSFGRSRKNKQNSMWMSVVWTSGEHGHHMRACAAPVSADTLRVKKSSGQRQRPFRTWWPIVLDVVQENPVAPSRDQHVAESIERSPVMIGEESDPAVPPRIHCG